VLNKISFYQFDNLIKNRIPFMFVNFGADVSIWYESIYKIHIERHQVLTTLDQAENLLAERKIPHDFAILLLCQNGKQSENFAGYLQRNSYTNVYLVDGGIQQMMTDKEK
jgi:rhodanese-related sulfurtransferase